MRRYWTACLLALICLLATGCELRVATDVVVAADHSGEVVVTVALDDETARDLVEAGLVPDNGLAEAAANAPDWAVEPLADVTAGVRLRRAFDHPAEVGPLLAALGADLGIEDGALWDGLRLVEAADGGLRLEGRAGVLAPTVAGAEGAGVAFDGEDLARVLAQRGRSAVRHDLQLTAAGGYGQHDADREADGSLVWELPTGELRSVSAVVEPTPGIVPIVYAVAGLLAAALAFAFTWLWRRRA